MLCFVTTPRGQSTCKIGKLSFSILTDTTTPVRPWKTWAYLDAQTLLLVFASLECRGVSRGDLVREIFNGRGRAKLATEKLHLVVN